MRPDQAITLYGYMLESKELVACLNLLLGYGNVYTADSLDDLRTGKQEYRDRNGGRPRDDAKRAAATAMAALLRDVADGLEQSVSQPGAAEQSREKSRRGAWG